MPRGRFVPLLVVFVFPALAAAQVPLARPRINPIIDDNIRTTLKGNTHPLARPEFDQGAAPPNLAINRILLVLKRSPEQETALQELLEEQQDKSSPNYHQWLTPERFGQQFGPADQDIEQVTSWLTLHGFEGIRVSPGRTMIEFSGDAAQVEDAFQTSIHRYVVNGEEHWANSADPQIPAALAPVVAGPLTLHNFVARPQVFQSEDQFSASFRPGSRPQLTSTTGQNALGPQDFAAIYNANLLYTQQPAILGNGVRIAVVGRSNVSNQDLFDFRRVFFGSNFVNTPLVLVNGTNPGDLGGGEELEAVLDASWAGALAPDAAVSLIVSATTATTDGIELSELYIIDNNFADIMTSSFGFCEGEATSDQAAAQSLLAEQAAAQGITFAVASGDSGASGCDLPMSAQATHPVSVNLAASTPYTVAVGGTEFNEMGDSSLYWNSSSGSLESALSYIPEDVWNESCAAGQCPSGANPALWAGGGGASVIFGKPAWQAGVAGIPAANARYVPDVSLSAASHDPYLICLHLSCEPNSHGLINFEAVSGTSASAQAFGGVMALIVQKAGSRQGLANFSLYKLAAAENLGQCNSSSAPVLAASSSCIFNDVTTGSNAVPGETGYGTPNTQYQSGVGYDLATGLGSVNIANLVNGWSTAQFTGSVTTFLINNGQPLAMTHGQRVPISVSVSPRPPGTGTPTGDVGLTAGENADQGFGLFTLNDGSVNTSTYLLPGGTYSITAHYEGDATFGASVSSPSPVITVNPEPSKATVAVWTFDSSGNLTNSNAGTFPFDSRYVLHVNLNNAAGTPCLPAAAGGPVCPGYGVSLWDTFNGQKNQLDAGFYAPDPFGIVQFEPQLSVGTHIIEADYTGDKNFLSSSATLTVTVTPLAVTISAAPNTVIATPGGSAVTTVTISEQAGYDPILLSCAGLPALAACSFSPPSVSGTGKTTLTISTTAPRLSTLHRPVRPGGPPMPIEPVAVLMLASSSFVICSGGRRRMARRLALILASACIAYSLASCSGGSSSSNSNGGPGSSGSGGTPAGQYSVVISGNGTGFTETTTLTLTVQ